jgi:hypothetical protein
MATAHTRGRRNKQRKIVGFYREDGKTKPITKPLSEFSRKKIIENPGRFKKVSPSVLNRLKALRVHNAVLRRFSKPKKEFMFGTEVQRYGSITFDYEGHHEYDVVIVPHEFWVASWSRYLPEVYIDDNLAKKYWLPVSLHEGVEKYAAEVHHLEPDLEAHKMSVAVVEDRWLLKHFNRKERVNYDWAVEEVQRKEWMYLKQFGTPMLTPIIRTHHGGGKKTPSNVAAEVISSFNGKIFSTSNDAIHFNVAGKNINLRFVDKKEIAPLYGVSYNTQGLIKIRNDLPGSVQHHVLTHEIEHQLGRGTEKAANVASFLKDPSGWIQTAGRTLLDPERRKYYLQRSVS